MLDSKSDYGGGKGNIAYTWSQVYCSSDQNLNNLDKYNKDVINPAK